MKPPKRNQARPGELVRGSTARRRSINTGLPPHAPGAAGRRDEDEPALELPHERDQGLRAAGDRIDPRIEQARRDLAAGQVDTDLRAMPGLDAERRRRLLRKGR